MLAGFILTAGLAGAFLDPFSPQRLLAVAGAVSAAALLISLLAAWGVEGGVPGCASTLSVAAAAKPAFRAALAEVWAEPEARNFTVFIFLSMLAYSAQDLILEPFAGAIFGYTPGQSTALAGVQNGGVLTGMLIVGLAATVTGGGRPNALRFWILAGCLASAAALVSLAVSGQSAPEWPLRASVFLLGFANGSFAVAAIAAMMALQDKGRAGREGTRMGLWGAAQAVAFGLGGFLGAASVDIIRILTGDALAGYSTVFATEAVLFIAAGVLALRIGRPHGMPNIIAIGETMVPAGAGER
jgi:MFS transporter, BCD family, chlorophyll transporter